MAEVNVRSSTLTDTFAIAVGFRYGINIIKVDLPAYLDISSHLRKIVLHIFQNPNFGEYSQGTFAASKPAI